MPIARLSLIKMAMYFPFALGLVTAMPIFYCLYHFGYIETQRDMSAKLIIGSLASLILWPVIAGYIVALFSRGHRAVLIRNGYLIFLTRFSRAFKISDISSIELAETRYLFIRPKHIAVHLKSGRKGSIPLSLIHDKPQDVLGRLQQAIGPFENSNRPT